MRHVHSDIPAVEFARPLNAETQNTVAVLTNRIGEREGGREMCILCIRHYYTYIARREALTGFSSAWRGRNTAFNCDGVIAESTVRTLTCLKLMRLVKPADAN